MKRFINYMKRWNWSAFLVMFACAGAGAAGNKTINTFYEGVVIVLGFSLTVGLFLAWLTKDEV